MDTQQNPHHPTMDTFAHALPEKIDSLWNFSAVAETETKFRALLDEALALPHTSGGNGAVTAVAVAAGAALGKQHPQVLELLAQIARTQGLQRKFDDAHATLDAVQQALLLSPSDSDTPVDRSVLPVMATRANVRYLLERGRVFNSSNHKPLALPLFVHAWEIANKCSEENLAVDAAHMVAIAQPLTASQLEWNLLALAKSEASDDNKTKKWIASLANNLAWTYHDANQFDDALVMFEKALRVREEQGDRASLAIAKWSVARCLRSLARLDEALAIQLALEQENDALGTPDGYNYEELGELYLLKGNATVAKGHFQKAVELLAADEWFVANEKERLARLQELAK